VKPLLATALVWLHTFAAVSIAQRQETALAEALQDWTTVRICLVIDGGDYNPPSPFILLQRLDSDRVILSSSEESARSELLPVARAIITSKAAQKFIDRAVAFYAQAQKEIGEKARVYALPQAEREPILKQHSLGMSALYIGIHVFSHNRSYEYQDDFADSGNTVKDFGEFVMHPKADSK
jgi:hypothetical protein